MLKNKKVAGTVILHLEDGTKKFLLHTNGEALEFASADFSEERTGLANILELLKESVHLDINGVHLVELTNGHTENMNLPLFVFETFEEEQPNNLPDEYTWAEARMFRQIIQDYEIEGVPFF